MSNRPQRAYLVRGFDPSAEPFKQYGPIAQRVTYREVTLPTQAAAIVQMLTANDFKQMSASHIASLSASSASVEELYVIKLVLTTSIDSARDIDKDTRANIVETIKFWAEKLRIPGKRGFRISAIKTPIYEKDEQNNGNISIKTEVILGSAIFYSSKQHRFNEPGTVDEVKYDLANLATHLAIATPDFLDVYAEHSKFGEVCFNKGDALPTLPQPVQPGIPVVSIDQNTPSPSTYPIGIAACNGDAGDTED